MGENTTPTPTPADGKKAVGAFLKSKGTAIGVTIGAVLVATGDFLMGDTGIIPYVISLGRQLIAYF